MRDRTATPTSSIMPSQVPKPCSGLFPQTRTPRASKPPIWISAGPHATPSNATASSASSESQPSAAGLRAAVAATLLLDASWRGVGDVPILGPEDLSFNEMAGIMSDVLGKAVRYTQIPFDTYKSTLIGQGWSEAMAQGMVDMMIAKDEGLDNTEPRTPQAASPTTFRQWCEEVLKPAMSRESS